MTESTAAKQTLLLVECLKILKNSRKTSEVETTIQILLKLDYGVPFITSDIGEDLLRVCVSHCESPAVADSTKQLIWFLQTSTENQINLSSESLIVLTKFCLRNVLGQQVQQTILSFHALGSLVYQNSDRLDSLWPELYQVLRSCLCENETNVFLRHSALKVLQALTIRRKKEGEYLTSSQVENVTSMIIEGVVNKPVASDEMMYCKIRVAAMKSLLNLANSGATFLSEHMSYLLGYLRHLTFYGFPGYAVRPIKNFDLFPSPVCQQLPQMDISELEGNRDRPVMRRRHGKKQSNRSQKNEASQQSEPTDDATNDSDRSPGRKRYLPWVKTDSSDAETSDSDNAQDASTLNNKLKNLKAKVRQLAYDTIRMLLLTINKKERFGYLLNFLPQQNGALMRSTEHTLVLSMLKDPDARVRTSSINVLKDFIANSKQYIILACESSHPTSFTSISEVMASIITELHRAIHLALLAENVPLFQIPLLSCLSLLINASPYNRLKSSVITEMVGDLRQILTSKFEQIRVAALTCLGGVASYEPRHPEIIRCLGLNSDHWLEDFSLRRLTNGDEEANSVKVEILQTLNLLVSHHFTYCTDVFQEIYVTVIKAALSNAFGPIRMHGLKLVAALANQIATSISAESEIVDQMGQSLWQQCLFQDGLFQTFFLQPHPQDAEGTPHEMRELQVLRRDAFTALAEIGPKIWDSLPSKIEKFCICVLLSHAKATTDDVALAAIRTLGVICTYNCTAHDVIFLQDVGDLCVLLLGRQINVSVKQKVSWTLSNVCDALWTLYKLNPSRFLAEVRPEFFNSLLRSSITAYNDKDAVRVNALRAIGLLLGMVTSSFMREEMELYMRAITLLRETMDSRGEKFFKAKWNACYAIGWILRNPDTRKLVDVDECLKNLSYHLLECINLKVQIACITALDHLSDADDLPRSVRMQAFRILLHKVSRISEIQVNYKELKHLQSTKENLCLALLNYLSRSDYKLFYDMPSLMSEHEEAVENLFKDSMSNLAVKRNLEDLVRSLKGPFVIEPNPAITKLLSHMPEFCSFEYGPE